MANLAGVKVAGEDQALAVWCSARVTMFSTGKLLHHPTLYLVLPRSIPRDQRAGRVLASVACSVWEVLRTRVVKATVACSAWVVLRAQIVKVTVAAAVATLAATLEAAALETALATAPGSTATAGTVRSPTTATVTAPLLGDRKLAMLRQPSSL